MEDFTGNMHSHNGGDRTTPSTGEHSLSFEDDNRKRKRSTSHQDWWVTIPLGMKFRPTDEILVINYLQIEYMGGAFATPGIINRLDDIYEYEPHQLPSMAPITHGDGKLYFFTYVKKIGKTMTDRKIKPRPGCHWKATQTPKAIVCSTNGTTVGYKTALAYYEEKEKKTQWLMHEYKLVSPDWAPSEERELVLAVVYHHQRKSRD